MMPQYGAITEQGDMQLGYTELNEKENQLYHESITAKSDTDEDNVKPIAEDNK